LRMYSAPVYSRRLLPISLLEAAIVADQALYDVESEGGC